MIDNAQMYLTAKSKLANINGANQLHSNIPNYIHPTAMDGDTDDKKVNYYDSFEIKYNF